MLDLGTSFLASVARDPEALAIVDGDVRLSYRTWYDKISALVAGLDALGLKAGDHLVTVLQNRWEAATIHWACQFAGIIITPLSWRSTAGTSISASKTPGRKRSCTKISPLRPCIRPLKREGAAASPSARRARRICRSIS